MKTFVRISLLSAFLVLAAASTQAQRVVKGTVYREGKPAAGITVELHRGGSMMTSFDGKYELTGDAKSKWIRFTFLNESKRVDLPEDTNAPFDYAFDGTLPGEDDNEVASGDVILKSAEELIRDQNRDFMNELTLYNEFYKQNNYKAALPHWKIIYRKYPKSTLNIYIHGANIYEKFIEEAATPEEKNKYIDDLMKMYDQRIKHFGDKGYVLGRKANHWLKYKMEMEKDQDNGTLTEILKKGYDWLNESMAERGNDSELPVIVLLMQTSSSLFKLGELPKETVVKNYDICNNALNSKLEGNTDAEETKNIAEIQGYLEDIFGKSGAADCEALVNIFTPQYEENQNDIEFIKSMLRRLGSANCDETSLFSDATEKLYELEPSAEAAFNMARRFLRRDDAERAKNYYQQAIEQETDKERLSKYYYEYALFIFAKEHALQEARNLAKKALEAKSNFCEALMLVGDIYAASSRNFGQDDFEKSSVFWIAVDYYERARSNPDCAVEASRKANDYRKYFPSKEEAFFRSLQEGQTYKVGGWINENTKIRF